jgi:predicted ATPase
LLDVFSLLAASAAGKLMEKTSELEGLSAMLTVDRAREMSFELSMSDPLFPPLIYQLTLSYLGVLYDISKEVLAQQRVPNSPPFTHIQSQHGDIRYRDQDL